MVGRHNAISKIQKERAIEWAIGKSQAEANEGDIVKLRRVKKSEREVDSEPLLGVRSTIQIYFHTKYIRFDL